MGRDEDAVLNSLSWGFCAVAFYTFHDINYGMSCEKKVKNHD